MIFQLNNEVESSAFTGSIAWVTARGLDMQGCHRDTGSLEASLAPKDGKGMEKSPEK